MLQLQPIDLVAPGFRGLNTEQSNALLDGAWATRADNATIDTSGRLAARKGYAIVTDTPVATNPAIKTLFEYIQESGTTEIIVAWDGGIGSGIDAPSGTDISGSVSDADGNWWFQNFNGKVLGFQHGQKPVVRTSGNFATVAEASGTAPTIAGGVGLAAYGRVWGLDSDYQTIKYSALLDETHWATGAGSIDMSKVWTNGTDQVTAIAAFNGGLVVFGHRHIVVWVDGTGNQLGIDPTAIVVVDVITGTGCESQWTLQALGESDLVFVSRNGLQSLSRIIQEKSAPLNTLTHAVSTLFLADLASAADLKLLRSVVDPTRGLYIVTFPSTTMTWAFHFTRPFSAADFKHSTATAERAVLYPITTWGLAPSSWLMTTARELLLGVAGEVGEYGLADADDGDQFTFDYESPYLVINEQLANRLKLLKRIGSILFVLSETQVTYRWDFDFLGRFSSKTKAFAGSEDNAEWGEAEWGEDEWSGAVTLRIFKFPAFGQGQYIKIGVRAPITSEFSIQQLELLAKMGRLA